ncbi:unnamed protein product [Prorocentrum cordatum]|uniref:Uncharacterized protein n=1 Tax=Prorocentrum cordatum TaxID=2364126 RepID=A0ABN9WY46_9DINO|nr:unnamed protein product [Polarella glacialis]
MAAGGGGAGGPPGLGGFAALPVGVGAALGAVPKGALPVLPKGARRAAPKGRGGGRGGRGRGKAGGGPPPTPEGKKAAGAPRPRPAGGSRAKAGAGASAGGGAAPAAAAPPLAGPPAGPPGAGAGPAAAAAVVPAAAGAQPGPAAFAGGFGVGFGPPGGGGAAGRGGLIPPAFGGGAAAGPGGGGGLVGGFGVGGWGAPAAAGWGGAPGFDLAAVPGGAGPWIHGPSAPLAHQRMGLMPGTHVEGVLLDSASSAVGTAVFMVQSAWPGDGSGCYVEGVFVGTSATQLAPMLSGSFGAVGGSVIHLCSQPSSQCSLVNQWPCRAVLHIETYRMRDGRSLSEPWIQGVPQLAAGADGQSGAVPTHAELQAKVAELKERLHRRRTVGQSLASRAEAALAGKRPRKNKKGDGDGSESSFDDASHVDAGRRIKTLSREQPRNPLASGMEVTSRYLARRGGAADSESLDTMSAQVVRYITSVWHGHHPQSEMGVRMKAIEQATKDGHWQVAQHFEFCDDLGVGLTQSAELADAVSKHKKLRGLQESVAKAHKTGAAG